MTAKAKPEPRMVRVGDKDYDVSKLPKWAQDHIDELETQAENAQGELFEEDTLIAQREAIADLWETTGERRLHGMIAGAHTLDGVETSRRAYRAARLVRAATQVGVRTQQL